jgi:phosphoribosylformylglycinamidine (FGAM) synthase PurS component
MTKRVVAIVLKIPDNAAYTALTALRRSGLNVERVERSEVWQLEDSGSPATLAERVRANATIFNPNKHRLEVLERESPRLGETWIDEIGDHDEVREHLGGTTIAGVSRARRSIGWRLRGPGGKPVTRETLVEAVEKLLCNPAIEKARYHDMSS